MVMIIKLASFALYLYLDHSTKSLD